MRAHEYGGDAVQLTAHQSWREAVDWAISLQARFTAPYQVAKRPNNRTGIDTWHLYTVGRIPARGRAA